LTGVRVLLVDDEADARELLAAFLRASGAEVLAVGSAADVRPAMDRFDPTVLVSDIAMPGQDGYTLIRELRASGHHIPAVAVTAYGRSEDRDRALLAGFQSHLAKPVKPDDLVNVVAVLAGREPSSAAAG
ncbi:MAG: response regulator, partial [bacterium]